MCARAGILQPPSATGAASAVVASPHLNNAPAFEVLIEQVIGFVTTQGSASPSSAGGGITTGAFRTSAPAPNGRGAGTTRSEKQQGTAHVRREC